MNKYHTILIIFVVLFFISTIVLIILYCKKNNTSQKSSDEYQLFSGQDSAGQTLYFGMFDGLFQTFSTGFGVYSASVNSTASSFTVTLGDIVTHFSFDPSPDHVAVVIVNFDTPAAYNILLNFASLQDIGSTIAAASGQAAN